MSRQRGGVLIVRMAAVAVAALVLAGCDIVVESLNSQASDEWTRRYTLAPGGQVEILNVNGAIEVRSSEGTTVEVRAVRTAHGASEQTAKETLGRVEIKETATPEQIRIETNTPRGLGALSRVTVEYHVVVPRTAKLRLRTDNGSLKMSGVGGAVKLETTNGSITAEQLGGAVDAGTTNGSVKIDVDTVAKDGIQIETTNGSVELRLPSSSKADLVGRCVNGSVHASNLNVESGGETTRRRLEGRLNGGGPRVELQTTNGSVRFVGK